jgi:hypothetical protein
MIDGLPGFRHTGSNRIQMDISGYCIPKGLAPNLINVSGNFGPFSTSYY